MAAAGTEHRDRALIIAMRKAERIFRQSRVVEFRFRQIGHEATVSLTPALEGEGRRAKHAGWGDFDKAIKAPPPGSLLEPTSPLQGEVKRECAAVTSITPPLCAAAA